MKNNQDAKILICEDDTNLSMMLSLALQSLGIKNRVVRRAHEIKHAILSFGPSVLVVDYHLEDGESGQEVRTLKSAQGSLPTLLITSRRDIRKLAGFMKVEAYLPKPFSIKEFLGKINNLLQPQVTHYDKQAEENSSS